MHRTAARGPGDGRLDGRLTHDAAFYIAKYVSKETAHPTAVMSRLADAFEHIKQWPSLADDAGTAARTLTHFLQVRHGRAGTRRGTGLETDAATATGER